MYLLFNNRVNCIGNNVNNNNNYFIHNEFRHKTVYFEMLLKMIMEGVKIAS